LPRRSSNAFGRKLAVAILFVLIAVLSPLPTAHCGRLNASRATEDRVHVGVLGLFHPREFVVSAPVGHALILKVGEQRIVLEDSGVRSAKMRIHGSEVTVTSGMQILKATETSVASRDDEPVDFILEVPRRITRSYHGTLSLRPSAGNLLAVVTLDLETAVASVVAAESTSDTPLEALKTQAIATRSYFVSSRGRHREFDFCDTTHCQFLRTAPASASPVSQAVIATRGLVLTYHSQPFAAMYTRSCTGHTHTPAELGLPGASYPYYSVECAHCRMRPVRWTSRVSVQDAASLQARNESARLAVDHRLGWSAVRSNDFMLTKDGDDVLLQGVGNGHGIGLCQAGAKAMAKSGAGFQEILEHYYPNTSLVRHANINQKKAELREGKVENGGSVHDHE